MSAECEACDEGRIWNNADPTSGQWVECDSCCAAQGTSGFAQDAQRLDPQGAGPVAESDAPNSTPRNHSGAAMTSPDLSGLIERVARIIRRVLSWFGPFSMAILGMAVMMFAVAGEQTSIITGVIGGLIILSAFEAYAERARAAETAKWAQRVAEMVASEGTTTFEVKHTFDTLQPDLGEKIEEIVAAALRAQKEQANG